jgi:hypothetical protein
MNQGLPFKKLEEEKDEGQQQQFGEMYAQLKKMQEQSGKAKNLIDNQVL